MPMSLQVEQYLRRHGVSYLEIAHPEAFTADGVDEATRLGERGLARVVAVRDQDDDWILAVVPARLNVDLVALGLASGRRRLRLASELDVVREFGRHELGDGAVFSEFSGMPIYVDDGCSETTHIYFQDGTHRGVFGMRVRDYVRLTRPTVAPFSMPR